MTGAVDGAKTGHYTGEESMMRETIDTATTRRNGRLGRLWAAVAVVAAMLAGLAAGGVAPAAAQLTITTLDGGVYDVDGGGVPVAATRAGSHPAFATLSFAFETEPGPGPSILFPFEYPVESLRDFKLEIPAGLIGNPQAMPKCTDSDLASNLCPNEAQVGFTNLKFAGFPGVGTPGNGGVYNMVPSRPGVAARFGFTVAFTGPIYLDASVRSDGDYGVDVDVSDASQGAGLISAETVLWGVPADPANDADRGTEDGRPASFNAPSCYLEPDPAVCSNAVDVPRVPLLSLPTSCSGPVETVLSVNSWQSPGSWDSASFFSHEYGDPNALVGGTDCDLVPFDPSLSIGPTSTAADSASGLDVDLTVPQDGLLDPQGTATAHLDRTTVVLPEGVSVNPSGAAGLTACSDQSIGLLADGSPPRFSEDDPFDGVGAECPAASKIGAVEVVTPLLEERLTGDLVLGEPRSTDPASGEMLRMFLVVRNTERGIIAKIFGSAVADPATGRLTATFDKNPQVPFTDLRLDVKGGARGMLATAPVCGNVGWSAEMTGWHEAHLAEAAKTPEAAGGSFVADANCANAFGPSLRAGMDTQQARGSGSFGFRFSRRDGEQYLRGLTARLPDGLLASVKDVPLCSGAQADAGACPAASKIGVVDAKAGAGDPFVLEEKGEVFLTEGYKGGEYGLAVKIRPVAGPFRGPWELSPILVRQAIHVDRATAEVSAISDPFPLIHHGIPLRAREVNVLVNRGGFMVNPSDCSAKRTSAALLSAEGVTSNLTAPFHASGCAALPFKPKLALSLTGRKQVTTGKHPGIKALVTQQGTSEAGIEKAVVRLPKSLALDPDNAQALCEFADGTKPDLENHCPKGSIVGRARAKTPLLKNDLVGNVYFVKNVRKDAKTGNEIRTLPMIIVALRGEIAINLEGESSTTKAGKLVNTFANVPDAPISQFNLNIKGGKTGILAVTRTRKARINLCAGRHIAEADMDGQNGKRHDVDVNMRKPCPRRRPTAAQVCRQRTNTKPALRRCVARVKANGAKAARRGRARS